MKKTTIMKKRTIGGVVHLVDWKSGASQGLGNENGTEAADDEKHLAVLTGEAEVYIWDVGQRRCVKKW